MSEGIKELVGRLRTFRHRDANAAADALEAMAGGRDAWEKAAREHMDWRERNRERANAAEAERDRLAGEVERLKEERDAARDDEELMSKAKQLCEAERDRLKGEVERLKRMLFPYAEDKEISGLTWNGFYLIGNKKSIDEFKRLENRAAQLETYRAEFVRRNEAAEAERDRLKAAVTTHIAGCAACGGSGAVFLCPEQDDTAEAVREDCEECVGLRKALGDAS